MASTYYKQTSVGFNRVILREYDIRGTYGETLKEYDAYLLGKVFPHFVALKRALLHRAPIICVGFDGRISSPSLEKALIDGLQSSGADVVRIGQVATPNLYYAVHMLKADGGIMITGSHNPPNHNGFKILCGTKALYGKDLQFLGDMAEQGTYATLKGSVCYEETEASYLAKLLQVKEDVSIPSTITCVWDTGNGAAGPLIKKLTQQLPGIHHCLNLAVDGNFPSHPPDPTIEANLAEIKETILTKGCDVGFAFDGDADRVVVLDDQGAMLSGDQLLALFAKDYLLSNPGKTVIIDVKASRIVTETITRYGGTPLIWKTGHSLIKEKMLKEGVKFAGEVSGHIFFADRYLGYDDGPYAALRVLSIMAKSHLPLSEMIREFPLGFMFSEVRIDVKEEEKFEIVESIKKMFETETKAILVTIDGIRYENEDGWWLLRASNTQSCLVARAEATTEMALDKLVRILAQQLDQYGVSLPL